MSSDDVLKVEIESVLADIRKLYESSGKKVTGRFGKELTAVYEPNSATIMGHVYLSGRQAGKRPPIADIEEWVVNRGIASANTKAARGIAYAIAKKIGEDGTNPSRHRNLYLEVLTPQRIDSIIDKVSQFNVTSFISELQTELKLLQTTF